ncbi:MAG: Fe-S protein assembly co-chaperone HscB, partial [Gammaproteobacteria bacterium]|nr:Fe-S protein assembly co-chaperone HscB [Gammaproteobacteria bacterium]
MLSIADNYFSQFELPVGYDIDLDRLNGQFRELQTIVHPDRYAAAGDEQRLRAIKLSSYLNEAYETLKSPLRRAG